MTVSVEITDVSFSGNGSATEFNTGFPVLNAEHLALYIKADADSSFELLSLNADYSVTDLGDENGATVTYPLVGSAAPSGSTLLARRIVPYQQLFDVNNSSGFLADTLENQLDLIVMMIQQLNDASQRSIRIFEGEIPPIFELVENGYLFYDGENIVTIPDIGAATIATTAQMRSGADLVYVAPKTIDDALSVVTINPDVNGDITFDTNTGRNFVTTLDQDSTMTAPQNINQGRSGYISVVQDATGGRTLSWGVNYKFPGDETPEINTAADGITQFGWFCPTANQVRIFKLGEFT